MLDGQLPSLERVRSSAPVADPLSPVTDPPSLLAPCVPGLQETLLRLAYFSPSATSFLQGIGSGAVSPYAACVRACPGVPPGLGGCGSGLAGRVSLPDGPLTARPAAISHTRINTHSSLSLRGRSRHCWHGDRPAPPSWPPSMHHKERAVRIQRLEERALEDLRLHPRSRRRPLLLTAHPSGRCDRATAHCSRSILTRASACTNSSAARRSTRIGTAPCRTSRPSPSSPAGPSVTARRATASSKPRMGVPVSGTTVDPKRTSGQ